MPTDKLSKTVPDYNAAVKLVELIVLDVTSFGSFSANSFAVNKIENEKFYAVALIALCVMTLGGVSVNDKMRVLVEDGTVIPGLYATGEVTGGIWGRFISGGTGVMRPIVFGKIVPRE